MFLIQKVKREMKRGRFYHMLFSVKATINVISEHCWKIKVVNVDLILHSCQMHSPWQAFHRALLLSFPRSLWTQHLCLLSAFLRPKANNNNACMAWREKDVWDTNRTPRHSSVCMLIRKRAFIQTSPCCCGFVRSNGHEPVAGPRGRTAELRTHTKSDA